jgi:hypothetical protein
MNSKNQSQKIAQLTTDLLSGTSAESPRKLISKYYDLVLIRLIQGLDYKPTDANNIKERYAFEYQIKINQTKTDHFAQVTQVVI